MFQNKTSHTFVAIQIAVASSVYLYQKTFRSDKQIQPNGTQHNQNTYKNNRFFYTPLTNLLRNQESIPMLSKKNI